MKCVWASREISTLKKKKTLIFYRGREIQTEAGYVGTQQPKAFRCSQISSFSKVLDVHTPAMNGDIRRACTQPFALKSPASLFLMLTSIEASS